MLDKLNKLALELYSEFGFTTCTEEQQELIQGAQQVQAQGPPPGLAQVLAQAAAQGGENAG